MIITAILAIFTFGCSSASTQTKEINVFVGTDGLSVVFANNAPPQRVFESSDFPIVLRIRNNGAFSITDQSQGINELNGLKGLLTIGTEKDYVKSTTFQSGERIFNGDKDNEIYFFVDGKTQINPQGDELIVPIVGKTGKLDPQSERRISTITANLCYPYKTVLSTTLCLDPDIAGLNTGKKVCSVKDIDFNSGQGAPIAITRIESQMLFDESTNKIRPQFVIYIENKGKGTPVDVSSYLGMCRNTDYIKDTWNVAYLNAYTSGSMDNNQNKLECSPSPSSLEKGTGYVRFIDNKNFVKCTFKEGIDKNVDAFLSPLRIEITYGYVQTVATNFAIQKPATI